MQLRLTGVTFEVEYINYILIILGLMALIITMARLQGRNRLANNPMALAEVARKRKRKEHKTGEAARVRKPILASQHPKKSPVIKRQLARVPTPWGWPHHDEDKNNGNSERDLSASLHRFADRLIHEKKTVQDQRYLEKRNSSMRALLEDRYGRSSRMPEIQYQKVVAPLLRDPGAPHDQMDNFPSGKAEQLAAKLKGQSGTRAGRAKPARRDVKRADLKNLKTPWGW